MLLHTAKKQSLTEMKATIFSRSVSSGKENVVLPRSFPPPFWLFNTQEIKSDARKGRKRGEDAMNYRWEV